MRTVVLVDRITKHRTIKRNARRSAVKPNDCGARHLRNDHSRGRGGALLKSLPTDRFSALSFGVLFSAGSLAGASSGTGTSSSRTTTRHIRTGIPPQGT